MCTGKDANILLLLSIQKKRTRFFSGTDASSTLISLCSERMPDQH
jgi:hypothetical protein